MREGTVRIDRAARARRPPPGGWGKELVGLSAVALLAVAAYLYWHPPGDGSPSPKTGYVVPALAASPASAGVETPASAPALPPQAHPTRFVPPAIRAKLAGRWQRPDGGYVLEIKTINDDGTVQATYANPRPIHIATALAGHVQRRTVLYVELRDQGYPGNTYKLGYDPAKDELRGVYYHRGLGQEFDVTFVRLQ